MAQIKDGPGFWGLLPLRDQASFKKIVYLKNLFVYSLILFLMIILLKFSYYAFYFKIYLLLFIFMYFKFWILVS